MLCTWGFAWFTILWHKLQYKQEHLQFLSFVLIPVETVDYGGNGVSSRWWSAQSLGEDEQRVSLWGKKVFFAAGHNCWVTWWSACILYRSSKKDVDLPNQLLRFCQEIADAMEYLSKKGFIHRDLAARNILLTADTKCKVGLRGMLYAALWQLIRPFHCDEWCLLHHSTHTYAMKSKQSQRILWLYVRANSM